MKPHYFKYALTIFCFFTLVLQTNAQKIYSCDSRYDADVLIHVVDSRYDADLLVYKEESKYNATGNEGLWHFVESRYDADKKVYFTDSKYDADLLIYFVDSRYDAGWRNKERIYLLY
ncbi:MAG: hypothetical protein KQH67_09980 [Bacteroidetes bacterium]|nr:hypothetical protein [Bacteroidota bacterium]